MTFHFWENPPLSPYHYFQKSTREIHDSVPRILCVTINHIVIVRECVPPRTMKVRPERKLYTYTHTLTAISTQNKRENMKRCIRMKMRWGHNSTGKVSSILQIFFINETSSPFLSMSWLPLTSLANIQSLFLSIFYASIIHSFVYTLLTLILYRPRTRWPKIYIYIISLVNHKAHKSINEATRYTTETYRHSTCSLRSCKTL